MIIGEVDLDEQVFIVAEIGNNHEGNFEVACKLVRCAAEAGVDAVKFQTFHPEQYVSWVDARRLEQLRRFRLSQDQFARLAKMASDLGLIFFSTPLDIGSAMSLNEIQPVFKIASGDNTFYPLIETVAHFSKPLIISTGFADLPLLDRLRADVHRIWVQNNVSPGLAFLHCVGSYPVPPAQANLCAIAALRERFTDCTIGYSDHVLGVDAAIYAVAAGARIIEKHFTLDKSYSEFRDHALSADPHDMQRLVKAVRETGVMFGVGGKSPQPCELQLLTTVRRSVAAARDLADGIVLTSTDLTWVRPGTGIPPGEEQRLIGCKTQRALRQGELIQASDVTALHKMSP